MGFKEKYIDILDDYRRVWLGQGEEDTFAFGVVHGLGIAKVMAKRLFEQDERKQLEITYADITERGSFEFESKDYLVVSDKNVLSKVWIDENISVITGETVNVLKGDKEKPIVPKWLADYIKKFKKHNGHLSDAIKAEYSVKAHNWLHDYTGEDNQDLFARAWLAYPDIEVEESKYYAISKLSLTKNWENYGEDYFDGLHDESSNKFWLTTDEGVKPRTKSRWNEMGIDGSIAYFKEVEE